MDLDDLIEDLIPKKKLKKLKKKAKKQSILQLILAWLVALFVGKRETEREARAEPEPSRPEKRADVPPQRLAAEDPLLEALDQAKMYQRNIDAMAQSAAVDSVERMRIELISDRVDEWVYTIEKIVKRALTQQEDRLLAQERKQVPKAIKRLEEQLSETTDPMLRAKLERTLDNRRKQLAQLEQNANYRQMAELKVENTLAQLGIIYSQLHSGRYLSERSGYDRLSAEIDEEVHALEDYMHAYEEVVSS